MLLRDKGSGGWSGGAGIATIHPVAKPPVLTLWTLHKKGGLALKSVSTSVRSSVGGRMELRLFQLL